jgi:DNA-binding protein HU-beta
MTKTELYDLIAEISAKATNAKVTRKAAREIYEGIVAATIKVTRKEKECKLPGFGIVKLVKTKARKGRNPATGEEIQIKAKTVVKIRVAKALKDAILK